MIIGEGNGIPLQCSCLENPRDRGAWWAAVHGVAQSRTQLKRLSSNLIIPAIKQSYKPCICIKRKSSFFFTWNKMIKLCSFIYVLYLSLSLFPSISKHSSSHRTYLWFFYSFKLHCPFSPGYLNCSMLWTECLVNFKVNFNFKVQKKTCSNCHTNLYIINPSVQF